MHQDREKKLREMVNKCGVEMAASDLINQALTHPTYTFEHQDLHLKHNQRLEFLGDAVLDLIVAQELYQRFPGKSEGELTKIRAAVVCEQALAKAAQTINLGSYLLLGRGEELTGGRERPSILADALEALIAAIYLEAGLTQAAAFVIDRLSKEIDEASVSNNYGDFKTILQERVQQEFGDNVHYVILDEKGPDHNKQFIAGVSVRDRLLAQGPGRSKKEAEQQAAKAALEQMDK